MTYAYSPYGETVTLGPDEGNPLQYTGRENDGTGLYYYRARYYDPVLKRFVSNDPIGTKGGINLYAYVGGDPIKHSDPFGLHHGTPGGDPYPGCGNDACCRAGLCPPPQNQTELCCDQKKLSECLSEVPGVASDCRLCVPPYWNNIFCYSCGVGVVNGMVCIARACKRVPKGQCKPDCDVPIWP